MILNRKGRLGVPMTLEPSMYKKLYHIGPTTLSNAMSEERSPASSPCGNPDLVPAETKEARMPMDCAAPRKPMITPTTAPL
eukprot:scaffold6899_cov183-Amphora_coffeaeformis.AAC.11